jgi:hypothetical protein
MGIRWESKIILAKIETTYGVSSVPGAGNAMLMTDVELKPMEGEDVSRNLERPYFGAQDELPVGLHSVLTGSVELVASGSLGVAPKWGPLARACALAEVITADTSVVYNPVAANLESVTIFMWIENTRYVMTGVRGKPTLMINAQGIPVIRFELTGLFNAPSEQSRVTPDFTGWQDPLVATTANTPTFAIGGIAFVMRTSELDVGNQVEKRFLIGRDEIIIVDRAAMLSATVEALPLSTFNPFSRAIGLTNTAVSIVHGTTAGYRVGIDAPAGRVRRLTGLQQQQKIKEWPLRVALKPVSGNDDFTITLN